MTRAWDRLRGRSAWSGLVFALAFAGACSPAAEEESTEVVESGAWPFVGTLSVLVADHEDGTAELMFELETKQDTIQLFFDHVPDLDSGMRVGVSGRPAGVNRLSVSDYAVLSDPVATSRQALIGAPQAAPKPILALLVAPGGQTDGETVESFREKVFTGASSTREYYAEASYGIESLIGDVHGWLTVGSLGDCDTRGLATQARAAAEQEGIDLSEYGQIMYYFPRDASCSWAGLAQVGRPGRPAQDSWYNGYSSCGVLAHELGHNYGLQHSGSWNCGSVPLAADTASCTRIEYGDVFCPMGSGCWHMNGFQKTALGWLRDCNVVDVRQSGSFAVEPMALPTNGIQTLRVAIGDDQYLYIEYRASIGLDHRSNPRNGTDTLYQGVLLRVAEYTVGDPNVRPSAPTLLDMTPGSRANNDHNDAALLVGESYTTPDGNVTVTLDALDETRAQVQVVIANPEGGETTTCLDGSDPPVGVGGPGGGDPGDPGSGGGGPGDPGSGGGGPGDPGSGGGDPGSGGEVPPCVELPTWTLGTTETIVVNAGGKYTCTSPALCELATTPAKSAYEPGVGFAWQQAWRYEEDCEVIPDPDPGSGTGGSATGNGSGNANAGTGGGSGAETGNGAPNDVAQPGGGGDKTLQGRISCAYGSRNAPGSSWGWLVGGLALWGLRRRALRPLA